MLRSQDNSHPLKPESHGVPKKLPTDRASYLATFLSYLAAAIKITIYGISMV